MTLRAAGEAMGFSNVASGAMVRSSYHADQQAKKKKKKKKKGGSGADRALR